MLLPRALALRVLLTALLLLGRVVAKLRSGDPIPGEWVVMFASNDAQEGAGRKRCQGRAASALQLHARAWTLETSRPARWQQPPLAATNVPAEYKKVVRRGSVATAAVVDTVAIGDQTGEVGGWLGEDLAAGWSNRVSSALTKYEKRPPLFRRPGGVGLATKRATAGTQPRSAHCPLQPLNLPALATGCMPQVARLSRSQLRRVRRIKGVSVQPNRYIALDDPYLGKGAAAISALGAQAGVSQRVHILHQGSL